MIERHGLIMLSIEAAQRIAGRVWNEWFKHDDLSQSEWYLSLLNGLIPAIVRRGTEKEREYGLPVGVSLPVRLQNQRIRMADCLTENEAVRYVTPYQISSLPYIAVTPSLKAFEELAAAARSEKFELGVWGSNALQIVTGLNYTDKRSDLDVLVRGCSQRQLLHINQLIVELEDKYRLRVDVEIALDNGYGVNLKEFLQPTRKVLAKSLTDVALLDKTGLIADGNE